jgi:hypothetical protein
MEERKIGGFRKKREIVLLGEKRLTSKDNRPRGQVGGGSKYD